ncbi:hypothetical protein BH09ACT12_BH09ACT12_30100 [soil metagenome]
MVADCSRAASILTVQSRAALVCTVPERRTRVMARFLATIHRTSTRLKPWGSVTTVESRLRGSGVVMRVQSTTQPPPQG